MRDFYVMTTFPCVSAGGAGFEADDASGLEADRLRSGAFAYRDRETLKQTSSAPTATNSAFNSIATARS
jgi:hypothetical protein